MLTGQSVQSVWADMVGPYRSYNDVASDAMVESSLLLEVNDVLTCVILCLVV
jgi:hypothetical protein